MKSLASSVESHQDMYRTGARDIGRQAWKTLVCSTLRRLKGDQLSDGRV